jgi:hypothetical protein
VVHSSGHAQPAPCGAVNQDGTGVVAVGKLSPQRTVQRCGVARVAGRLDRALVRQQVGLQRHVEPVVQRLDLVGDGREHALGEGNQAPRRDAHGRSVRCGPVGPTLEDTGTQVQGTLMETDTAVPQVEG